MIYHCGGYVDLPQSSC